MGTRKIRKYGSTYLKRLKYEKKYKDDIEKNFKANV